MKHQRLDDFIKGKFDGEMQQPPNDMWSRIENSLDTHDYLKENKNTNRKSIFLFYRKMLSIGVAASILVTIAVFSINEFFPTKQSTETNLTNKNQILPVPPINLTQTLSNSNRLTSNNNSLAYYNQSIQQNQNSINQYIQNYSKGISSNQSFQLNKNFDVSSLDIDQYDILPQNSIENHYAYQPYTTNSKNTLNNSSIVSNGMSDNQEFNTTLDEKLQLPKYDNLTIVIQPKDKIYINQPNKSSDKKNSLIALGGGYNYGTLEQGYALTLSTKKDINNNWYIEGNMGVVYNEAGNNQSKYPGDYLSFKKNLKANPNSVVAESYFYNPDNYLFLQINPVFGYKITPHINVGFGPDYQQLITNLGQDIIYFPQAASGKLLPRSDFGILGKAEFRFTKRIKAGFVYREGVTSYIRNDINIQNRSYYQFQLNYILHKN